MHNIEYSIHRLVLDYFPLRCTPNFPQAGHLDLALDPDLDFDMDDLDPQQAARASDGRILDTLDGHRSS